MPYTPPGTLTAAERSPSSERNHHRSRSFTDEAGPGAFAPLSGIPRRNVSRPATPKFTFPSSASSATSDRPASPAVRSPKFNIAGGSGSSEDSDGDDDDDVPLDAPLANKVVAAISTATANGGPPTPPPEQIPFPSISTSAANSPVVITAPSPIGRSVSSPQIQSPSGDGHLTPSIYRSPYSSLRSDPSTKIRTPLKPALKSNHSSPHLPSLAHQRSLTQSAPSTPNLTAWQSQSGESSVPGSPGSASYSIPQTPKQVHFASEKTLESVVVFTKGARPRSLSNPGGNDTETETEGYDSSGPSWQPKRYPFPVMPKDETVVQLDEVFSSEVPSKSAIGNNGYSSDGNDRRFVLLETVTLPSTKPPTLRGSVLVRNIAFQKRVAIRFTLDDWQTTSEVSCPYSASLQALPPPFSTHASSGSGHLKSASISHMPADRPLSNGKGESWDRFTFTIKLEDMERSLPTKKMFLVARYQVPSQWGWESGGEWWDNNDSKNYEVAFKLGKRATSASNNGGEEFSPANLSARLAASLQRQQQQEANASAQRTQSLPPLPPPGPVRHTASPTTLSPVSSVLGLKLNKPTLPPLSNPEPLKLRAGRGPTFAEVRNSPPGSPVKRNSPTRTNYTPPLPGTVPGITHGIIVPPPAPAPAPAPAAEKKDDHKPVGLTISTTGLSSPTGTIGKKRGLSLSNYASPSPSAVKSPSVPNNSSTSLSSLLSGGDGGENAYKHAYKKDSAPATPEWKLVGGMPATMIDENALSNRQGSVPPPRISSWDTPLNGFWNALGGVPAPEKTAQEEQEEDDGMLSLPTPPDSSDSMLSTPDLERSPDQEVPPAIVGEQQQERDSPTPTSMADAAVPTSFVPFPTASPAVSPTVATFAERSGRRSPPKGSFSSNSDADSDSRPLSKLARRTSEQTGQTMRLELPARPTFKASPEAKVKIASPSREVTPPSSGASSPERRGSPTRKASRRISPPLSEGNASLGLGLNVTSGSTTGPPPEFLAKYCFYVSSPAVSPPTGTSSPSHQLSVGSPPLLNAFGTGIDTPRASSPGLANVAAYWGYPGASTVTPDNVTIGAARV